MLEGWKRDDIAKSFLSETRAAIPLADEQIEIMLRLIGEARPGIERFLDLGCGDGILGRSIFAVWPESRGVFVDFSEPMIEAARGELAKRGRDYEIVHGDLSNKSWTGAMASEAPFDAVVSGLAIHHLSHERKKELYAEIYGLLKPGGIFLNLEHVAPASPWLEELCHEMMVESIYSHHVKKGGTKSRDELSQAFYKRQDRELNILAPVEDQLEWLRKIGYGNVDCYMKLFEIALFGGTRP